MLAEPKKLPPPHTKQSLLSADQLVLSFMTGNYSVSFCSIFSLLHHFPPWMESLHQHLISTRLENDNWEPSCGAAVCQLPSRRSHWWLPCGFYFPQGNPQPGLTACQICWVPQTSSAKNPPSYLMGSSKQLCWTPVSAPVPGTPQASTHSAFRERAPLFKLACLSKNFSVVIW